MLELNCENLNSMITELRLELETEKSKAIGIINQRDKAQFELQKTQLTFSMQDYAQ